MGMGLSFFILILTFFVGWLTPLPHHPVGSAMLSFVLYLLGLFWAYYTLFFHLVPVAQHYCWAYAYAILGFINPFHSFRAPLAQFYSFGGPRPIPILTSHSPLLSILGFPDPNYHILYFGVYRLFHYPHYSYHTG